MHDARAELDAGIHFERMGVLAQALERYETVAGAAESPALVSEALRRKSDILRQQCQWASALKAARAAAEMALRFEMPELFAEALNAEALVYLSRGDFAAAKPLLERVLEIAVDARVLGIAHQNLGQIAALDRSFEEAAEHFIESRERFRSSGYQRGEAIALNNQAAVANLAGNHSQALEVAEEAFIASRRVDDHELMALASLNQAEALIAFGRYGDAEQLASQAYGFFGIAGNQFRKAGCMRLLGDIYRRQARADAAFQCYERGLRIANGIDARTEVEMIEGRMAEMTGPNVA